MLAVCATAWPASAVSAGNTAVSADIGAPAAKSSAAPRIPLCPGLVVVTAVSQREGDYESIKTVESIDGAQLRLKYSAEGVSHDLFGGDVVQHVTVHRTVFLEDLQSASLYLQQYYAKAPDSVRGTTAIGTSAAVLRALKTRGEAELTIFQPMSGEVGVDPAIHPNVSDFQMTATLHRVESTDVMLPVLVNGIVTQLPTVHASGDYFGDRTELYFLDDEHNPLTIKYRFGVGALGPEAQWRPGMTDAQIAQLKPADRDDFDVVRISFTCAPPAAAAGEPPAGSAAPEEVAIETSLAKTGKAVIYNIYFSFNSDRLRDESQPTLKAIAAVLARHPEWKLNVVGHTDNVGGSAFNLGLSQRRAAAVRNALVQQQHVAPDRLAASGAGDTQPQDNNATLEGRARNRRVELTRQ